MLRQENLREIANVLDRYLGIEARKSLMAGHERLMMGTSSEVWSHWLHELQERLVADNANSAPSPAASLSARERCITLVSQIVDA